MTKLSRERGNAHANTDGGQADKKSAPAVSSKGRKKSRPVGRPSKYDPKFCKEIIEFFSEQPFREVEITHTNQKTGQQYSTYEERPNRLPFFSAFARKIGVNTDTLNEWGKQHPEFSDAFKQAKDLQREFMIENGVRGLYAAAPFVFSMKNMHEWRDQSSIDHNHAGEIKHTVMGTIKLNGKELDFDLE